MSMIKVLSAAIAAAICVTFAGAVVAQGDLITQRKDLMKANGAAFRPVTPMLRGEQPYDKAVADRSVAVWVADGQRMAALFPAGSGTGDTRALPAIWSDAAGWTAAIERFKAAAAAAQGATGSLDTFRPAVQAIGAACQGCHDKFQRPQS